MDIKHTQRKQTFASSIAKIQKIKAFSYFGLGFFGFTVLSHVILPRLVSPLLLHLFPALKDHYFMTMPLNYAYLYLVAFPLLFVFMKQFQNKETDITGKPIKWTTFVGFYSMGHFFVLAIGLLAAGLDNAIGKSTTVTAETVGDLGMPSWLPFIFVVIVAPVMEEIIFRWLPYKKLSGYGEKNYVIWTSIIFGLFHMNIGQSVYTGLLGVLLAVLTYRTGSIKYSILLHFVINLSGGLGIGGIAIRSNSLFLLSAYGIIMSLVAIAGLVCLLLFLVKYRKQMWTNQQDIFEVRSLVNVGTILFSLIPFAVILLAFWS